MLNYGQLRKAQRFDGYYQFYRTTKYFGGIMKSYQSLGVGPAALSPKSPYSVSLLLSWCRPLLLLVAFCLSMAVVMPAWAGDGSLDPTFSNLGAGVQKIPIIQGQIDYLNAYWHHDNRRFSGLRLFHLHNRQRRDLTMSGPSPS